MPRSLSTALQTQVSSTATKTAFLVELNSVSNKFLVHPCNGFGNVV